MRRLRRQCGKETCRLWNQRSPAADIIRQPPRYRAIQMTAPPDARGQDVMEGQREKFGMALIRQVCYCSVRYRISRLIGRNYASSYLVRHCRFSCRLRRESTAAYTSVDHVDNCAWHYRLDYRRSSDAFVLPAERWGSISSRWVNCFHTRRNLGPFSLAQVPPASAARLD